MKNCAMQRKSTARVKNFKKFLILTHLVFIFFMLDVSFLKSGFKNQKMLAAPPLLLYFFYIVKYKRRRGGV